MSLGRQSRNLRALIRSASKQKTVTTTKQAVKTRMEKTAKSTAVEEALTKRKMQH